MKEKELSIEEKAKRYDESIIRAKSLIGDTIIEESGQHIAEVIFPELKEKESEDDKIRKSLINYVHCYGDAGDFTKKEFIAWIEKQGEQKPTFVNNFRTWLYIVADVLTEFNGIGQYLDNSDCREIAERLREKYCFDDTSSDWQKVYQKGLKVGEIYGRNKAKKEQEQKLVEWSEEDERIYRSITYSFAHNFPLTIQQQEFVKSLKDRYTWKPSDEQNIYKNGVYQETNGVRIWHNGHTFLVPKDWNKGKWPLLNKKGEKNSKQNKEYLMNEIDALLDWDFVAATKHIQDLGTDIPLKDGEYLITAPVWLAMYEHRIALNKALSNIDAMEIDFNEDFWFAERYNVYDAWFFYGTNRNLYSNAVYSAVQVGAVSL